MASEPMPPPGQRPDANLIAETNGVRLMNGTIAPEKFILDGTLKLLAKLDAEMEGASGRALIDTGKLWMTTANGVLRAKRRLKERDK